MREECHNGFEEYINVATKVPLMATVIRHEDGNRTQTGRPWTLEYTIEKKDGYEGSGTMSFLNHNIEKADVPIDLVIMIEIEDDCITKMKEFVIKFREDYICTSHPDRWVFDILEIGDETGEEDD